MPSKKPTQSPSLLDAVKAVPVKSSLNSLNTKTREQVVEVAKAFIAGEVQISKLQILATLRAQGVPLGRYTFDRLIENIRAGVVQ